MTIGACHDAVHWLLTMMAGQGPVLGIERADGAKRCEGVGRVGERADAAQLGGDGGIRGHRNVVDSGRIASRAWGLLIAVAGLEAGECSVSIAAMLRRCGFAKDWKLVSTEAMLPGH